jgi:uncharacterized repeat protein (TIGR01451 family)
MNDSAATFGRNGVTKTPRRNLAAGTGSVQPARPGALIGALALLLAAVVVSPAALAEVVLQEQVQKVETLLDAAGKVERRLTPADSVKPGDELRYTITVSNNSAVLVTAGRVVVTNPIPDGTVYVPGSAGGADTLVEFSGDGETFVDRESDLSGPGGAEQPPAVRSIRWSLQRDLEPGAKEDLFFHVRMTSEPAS